MEDNSYEIGVIAGNFDVVHPGYVKLFKTIARKCDTPFILLHEDPTIERPEKCKPILSVSERKEMISSLFNYDMVHFLTYNTEDELYFLLKSLNPDVRFLGDDYIDKEYTGKDLGINIEWIDRSHGWSTTKFKQAIADSLK